MAAANTISTLRDDISTAISPSYTCEALLDGALSLLNEMNDEGVHKKLFSVIQIVEAAQGMAASIYLKSDDLKVLERADRLEGGAA